MTIGLAAPAVAQTATVTPSTSFTDLISEDAQSDVIQRKLVLPTAGMYTLRAPANSGIQVRFNGDLLIDATGERIEDVGQSITAFISLEAGAHAVSISGVTEENINIVRITFNAAGQTAEQLFALTTELGDMEAAEILTARSGLDVPQSGASGAGQAFASNGAPFTPFSIGGGSSGSARSAAATASAGAATQLASADMGMQNGMGGRMSSGMGGGSSMSAQGGGTTSSGGTSGGGTSGGGTVSTPVPVSGGGVSVPSPTVPTPTAPTPTAPPPTPTPPPVDPVITASVTPLTPPAIEPNQVIQLIGAGNEENIVPNTGTTLFGAVMADSVFDQVDVTFTPDTRGETTTVAVGAETGQFAIRTFPSDFENNQELMVTIVGRLSSNEEVTSEPVTYTVEAAPVADGVGQALSRITYGATPELYARIRQIGFEAYVQEQLEDNPAMDAAFRATQPEELLDWTTRSSNNAFNSLMNYDIAYAAFSERQLREVMGRFWSNHFHAITKGTNIHQQAITDRIFFRENALGNFEDLLMYSAKSPLMSQYLDNDENRVDGRRGLNQNYAREILELSTVGVGASFDPATGVGYTEVDIDAVARIFTGWAYIRTNPDAEEVAQEYEFNFFPERHDTDDKTIPFLNLTIEGITGPDGVQEGEELVGVLAQHPSTRSHLCGKIVQLLVADQPPENLVAACDAAWAESGGEVVPMLEAILLDPSYISTVEYQRTKVKTPFEYSVSAIRAFGASPVAEREGDFYRHFREVYTDAGYVPHYFGAPTGLPEVGAAWVSSAKMVAAYDRMNFIAERRQNYGIDLLEDVLDAGLETAEEVAAYLLTVATADRYTKQEFDKVVEALNGTDGFDPLDPEGDETRALERAMAVVMITPSFLLQ